MNRVINDRHSGIFVWLSAAAGFLALAVYMTVAFVLAALGGYRTDGQLESYYRHELYELADSAYNLETAAAKLMISRSKTGDADYLRDLDRHAYAAAESLSKLPIEAGSAAQAMSFLNRVSDYAQSNVAGYEDVAESIYATARRLNEAIGELLDEVSGGKMLTKGLFTLGHDYPADEGDIMKNSIDYPELIYDGPFSDGRKPECYKGLEELEYLTPEQAAARFSELFAATDAQILGESGYPETYEIAGRLGELPIYASLSKRGGMVINLSVNKTVQNVDLTEPDADFLAAEYAEHLGYENMRPVWYNANAGIAYVNLAPEIDGAIIYTDLVKVKIALDDGTVLGVEATGYCKNHVGRSLKPTMDADTAAALVPPHLKVANVRLCVVPAGKTEALCYEVAGEYKGLDYFVYLDARNGEQVNVLRVVDEGQGKLTI